MKKETELKERNYYVVKSNDIIRARYDLTLEQQRLLLFIISKIKIDDSIEQWYEFSLESICEALGLSIDQSGYYYKALKADILKLTERSLCLTPDGHLKTLSWVGDWDIIPVGNFVRIRFNPNMAPYLFELRKNYSQYKLGDVLVYRSIHSLRLYEILRSYTTQKKLDEYREESIILPLEKLKDELNVVGKYNTWGDFDRYVLKKAAQEINLSSEDIHIEYTPIKEGKSVKHIEFVITTARIRQRMNAQSVKQARFKKSK